MNALPKQVLQDMEEIAAYEKALTEPAPAEQTEAIVPDSPAAVVEEAVQTEPVAQPQAVPETKQPAPAEPWEQRYLTLKGMFDSQVPPLHAQVKELNHRLALAAQELEQAKSTPVPEVKRETLVTDQDEESFGKDLIDLQRRVASEVISPMQAKLDHLERENASLREITGQTGSQVATFSFENQLRAAVPDFDQINTDPRWFAWLDTVDPILRAPRRSAAQSVYANNDVEGVAHYMSLFRQETSARPVDTRQSELQSQVAPSRSMSSSATPVNAQERSYTAKEWDTLFDKVALLNRQGKTDEASRLETELSAAYTAGRVTR